MFSGHRRAVRFPIATVSVYNGEVVVAQDECYEPQQITESEEKYRKAFPPPHYKVKTKRFNVKSETGRKKR